MAAHHRPTGRDCAADRAGRQPARAPGARDPLDPWPLQRDAARRATRGARDDERLLVPSPLPRRHLGDIDPVPEGDPPARGANATPRRARGRHRRRLRGRLRQPLAVQPRVPAYVRGSTEPRRTGTPRRRRSPVDLDARGSPSQAVPGDWQLVANRASSTGRAATRVRPSDSCPNGANRVPAKARKAPRSLSPPDPSAGFICWVLLRPSVGQGCCVEGGGCSAFTERVRSVGGRWRGRSAPQNVPARTAVPGLGGRGPSLVAHGLCRPLSASGERRASASGSVRSSEPAPAVSARSRVEQGEEPRDRPGSGRELLAPFRAGGTHQPLVGSRRDARRAPRGCGSIGQACPGLLLDPRRRPTGCASPPQVREHPQT